MPYTHFLPDDITLLAFTQIQTDRFLVKTERQEANKFSMYFSYGDSILPVIKGLNFDADSAFVVEASEKRDTIHYWLRDTTLINQDTLRMEITYQITDTLGALMSQTDTLEALAKVSYEKRMKEKTKEIEQWQKDQEKKKKRGEAYDSIYPVKLLEPKYNAPSSLDPDGRVTVQMPTPLRRCDTTAVHLYSMIDSVWYESTCHLVPMKEARTYEIKADWRPGVEYSLEVDSAAFEDIYGLVPKAFKQGIKVKSEEEYGTLTLNLSGIADTTLLVQLLNASDNMVKEVRAPGHVAAFKFVKADKYYVRVIVDANGNGLWDTGDYDADQQAEAVYYYPREIECKEKWDISQSWNLTAAPRFRQKPLDITKQKPDADKKVKNRNAERARQLGIEYMKSKGVNL